MLTLILASILATPATAIQPAPAALAVRTAQDPNPEYDTRLAAAGKDPAKLWSLHEWCLEQERKDLSKSTLLLIIEVAPDHEDARKVLGHRSYDGKWFESYSALSKYRRDEEKRMLDEQGLVRFNDGWARPEDIPFLRMGWIKDEKTGAWIDPQEAAELAVTERKLENGWKQQDLSWVSPDEFELMDQGQFKCGEQWLPVEKANEYHAQLFQWWQHPGVHYIAMGTLPRPQMEWARWWADQSYPDIVRVLGREPRRHPSFLVLDSLAQYNTFAAGDQALGIPQTEISGSSSVHFAYFAESWVDIRQQPPAYRGQGVCFWDIKDPDLLPWGQYAVRNAAAQSYMEAIDPSWDTISQAFANPAGLQINTFWAEKKIPRWLRYGVAAYCERFTADPSAGADDDPMRIRAWAMQQLRAGGPFEKLDVIFAMALDSGDPAGSVRRMYEAGLIVSFIVDGDCAPVKSAHAAFRAAMIAGSGEAEAALALQNAVADNLPALLEYITPPSKDEDKIENAGKQEGN